MTMERESHVTRLAELLAQAASAHHAAFREVDGADPEWPLWYAEYLREPLQQLLGRELTLSELVFLLFSADEQHRRESPQADWKQYYAARCLERFGYSLRET
jgi:hypothetical protein